MKSSEERLAWALKRCEQSGMRMTSARRAILAHLSDQRKPVNLESVSAIPGVKDQCDPTTVYRTLMVFKDAGLVRCVGRLGRTSHFFLQTPGDAAHFLVCERCGAVTELEISPRALAAIERLASEHGFVGSRECLDLHGVCRACEEAARQAVPVAKVMARYCFI